MDIKFDSGQPFGPIRASDASAIGPYRRRGTRLMPTSARMTTLAPEDAKALKAAYDEAIARIASEDGVAIDVRAKLATLVLDIGRTHLEAGMDLRRAGHSSVIADVAIDRLLRPSGS